jgi:glucan 1,3-beta-glucosidase
MMQRHVSRQHERTLTDRLMPVLALVAVSLSIALVWWWLGQPVGMTGAAAPEKLQCMSYAPFRGAQSPLNGGTHIPAAQIEDDLVRLKALTGCVRTYSMELGLDQVPEIARRVGMKVIQGLWLSNKPDKNRQEIDGVIALAKRYPDVIQSIVVGNEVLLRGELSAQDLGNAIREVKRQVPMPVTYADVWEFWQRNRDLQDAVDFVTIHILPYWEDFPIPASDAAAHVMSIRDKMAAVFPGKDILIGETGWPSQGRMREGALPSRANQALILQQILAQAAARGYRVNVIEAFDQPWKRAHEGTVGGYWGLFDGATRQPKFDWGKPVSNHPHWREQAAAGIAFAILIFAAAAFGRRRQTGTTTAPAGRWLAVAIAALAGGSMIALAIERMLYESLGIGGWLGSAILVALAMLIPPVAAMALMRGTGIANFAQVLTRTEGRSAGLGVLLGFLAAALTVMAVQIALGLVFDPRYRDFPYAPLTAAIVPLMLVALFCPKPEGERNAERIAGLTLALSAIYIAFNESFANWQSLWLCGLLLALGAILLRRPVPAARS